MATNTIDTLAALLAPVTETDFFAHYHDREPLYVPYERPDKFARIMSWQILNRMLNMTAIWSHVSLNLVMDKEPVPPASFCREAIDRNSQPVLQPDAERVTALLRRGASLVANDIDTLHPELADVSSALETALSAKVQCNLYCSWQQHQAFDVHFDTHEVFALHAEGQKTWRVYEGRLDHPIAHESFKSLSKDYHERHKGRVMMELTLRPGDLLYIPRGYYHEALASSSGTMHVTFGATHVIGVDVLNLLYEPAFADSLFRTNLPRVAAGDAALRAHLKKLAAKLGALAAGDAVFDTVKRYREVFRYYRGGFNLPADALEKRFAVHARGLEVIAHDGGHVLRGAKGAVAIPEGLEAVVSWMISRTDFTLNELEVAFPDLSSSRRERVLSDMANMKVISSI
ncbi:MAG: JmjC domain-containing protein [Alphaproteobacteria bacterium]